MNKTEYKREARQLQDEAIARHLEACAAVAKELSKGLFAHIVEDCIPYLVENEDYLREMRDVCRFTSRDSAATVRNAWACCLVDDKHIRDNIQKIKEYIVF